MTKIVLQTVAQPLQRYSIALGLACALAVTAAWWLIVARGLWLAIEWASA